MTGTSGRENDTPASADPQATRGVASRAVASFAGDDATRAHIVARREDPLLRERRARIAARARASANAFSHRFTALRITIAAILVAGLYVVVGVVGCEVNIDGARRLGADGFATCCACSLASSSGCARCGMSYSCLCRPARRCCSPCAQAKLSWHGAFTGVHAVPERVHRLRSDLNGCTQQRARDAALQSREHAGQTGARAMYPREALP